MAAKMVRSGTFRKAILAIPAATIWLAASTAVPAVSAIAAETCRISVLGDSLTAAYGLASSDGFPAQLERRLRDQGYDCVVLDAGVSGDTTAGGLARLDWMLADQPSHVIVELGANDGLRGLPTEQMFANLDAILTRLEAENIPTLLTGMVAPPNLGRDYTLEFIAVFAELSERHEVPLYPFFLDGVAGDPSLNQPDGLHPTAEGIALIVDGIFPTVTAWLDATGG